MEIRNFTLIFFLMVALTSQAQQTLTISQPFTLTQKSIANQSVIPLNHGQLHGDFSGIDVNDFIKVNQQGFTIKDCDQPITFSSEVIQLNNINRIAFTAFLSGIGSLDSGGNLHDWIDVNYVLDGQRIKLGTGIHTLNAIPTDVESGWIITKGHETFQIEITMRITGDDETYTLEKIELNIDEVNEASLLDNSPYTIVNELASNFVEAFQYGPTEIAAEFPKKAVEATTTPPSTIDLTKKALPEARKIESAKITVFPNPTSDQLFLKFAEQFDLTKIELLNLNGQLLEQVAYPIDLTKYPAGMYFIRVPTLEGELLTAPFTVVSR